MRKGEGKHRGHVHTSWGERNKQHQTKPASQGKHEHRERESTRLASPDTLASFELQGVQVERRAHYPFSSLRARRPDNPGKRPQQREANEGRTRRKTGSKHRALEDTSSNSLGAGRLRLGARRPPKQTQSRERRRLPAGCEARDAKRTPNTCIKAWSPRLPPASPSRALRTTACSSKWPGGCGGRCAQICHRERPPARSEHRQRRPLGPRRNRGLRQCYALRQCGGR